MWSGVWLSVPELQFEKLTTLNDILLLVAEVETDTWN